MPVVRRWLELLAEAGLIAFGGAKDFQGRWRRLEIVLLEPPALPSEPSARSSAG